jgi:hypothetical protein
VSRDAGPAIAATEFQANRNSTAIPFESLNVMRAPPRCRTAGSITPDHTR